MLQILLYEFASGGGLLGDNPPGLDALLVEGRAMAAALAADFARLRGIQVTCLRDVRMPAWQPQGCQVVDVREPGQDRDLLAALAPQADWTVVIAPESAGILLDRARLVAAGSGRLLGPGLATIALAADKQAMAEHLQRAGVRVPRGMVLGKENRLPDSFCYPAVSKPRDGAGSRGVCFHRDAAAVRPAADLDLRLEQYCPGLPASVAFVCGPAACVPLPACRQLLTSDGKFTYLGGSLPLPRDLAARAARLARRAVASLPDPFGYLGVDLVLADPSIGGRDTVIEINPRLTTSYLGLSALARDNLTGTMLHIAGGGMSRPRFTPGRVRFASDGSVERLDRNPSGEELPQGAT